MRKTGKVEILDAGTFDATIREGVVLVDFWAPWCGPCRIQGPIVEKVAGRVGGRARIAKLDVDQAASLAQHYEIKSIPTLIVFKEGKPVKRFVGVTQADPLVSAITKAL